MKNNEDSILKLELLIERSELRIEQTHKMIDNLVNVVNVQTKTYIKHIDDITSSRDEVLAQNTKLIETVQTLISKVSELQNMYQESEKQWRNISREIAISSRSGNNINVN